ncbi:Uncharacterised protein [Mycobacteroides abscessus]|nr:Uncharacterised protein [Mycobacteroides abscessus]SKJ92898.1 Uncharacterised protein [Mycobacteroides abscessus subsp. massiliense]CPU62675.1 Uncharacterised protein [Mycobacteroides abscessus]SKQ13569.1 Uncharacterised protein [Mycobacteroides abscessus subsp. massiliense]SKV61755.1 Uncharacterised protein [Mycobacteroides abscessus subsp. massiliense]
MAKPTDVPQSQRGGPAIQFAERYDPFSADIESVLARACAEQPVFYSPEMTIGS